MAIKNKTLISELDINIIEKELQTISDNTTDSEAESEINILPNFYFNFINFKEIPKYNSNYAIKIKSIIDNHKNNRVLTLKTIKAKYKELYNSDISCKTISRILRTHLNIHYRKTLLKNPKLIKDDYILISYGFITAIIKSIKSGLEFIYIDESGSY